MVGEQPRFRAIDATCLVSITTRNFRSEEQICGQFHLIMHAADWVGAFKIRRLQNL